MEGTLNIKQFRKRTKAEQQDVTIAGLKALVEAQLGLLMKYRTALERISSGAEHPTDIAERILLEDQTHAISRRSEQTVLRPGTDTPGERGKVASGESRASELSRDPNSPSVASGGEKV